MVPVREGRRLWWYSSTSATAATNTNDAGHQERLSDASPDVRRARAARSASIAYSVKCAALRTKKWTCCIELSAMPGKSQSRSGRIILDVFDAEKFAEEGKSTKGAHARTGPA